MRLFNLELGSAHYERVRGSAAERHRMYDDDEALLRGCREGDRHALGVVFGREAPALERVISRLVGAGPDVEDLLQATLEAAVSAFPRFRGEASVRTWLTRIAVRTVGAHLQRPERTRRALVDVAALDVVDPAPAPDVAARARRAVERVYRHLDAIGPKKRIAFVLHVFDGLPIDQVAALMDATVMATKSRVFWARRALLQRARKDPVLRELADELEVRR